MNILEFITVIVGLLIIGIWGMTYLAYKYGDIEKNKKTSKSKKSK